MCRAVLGTNANGFMWASGSDHISITVKSWYQESFLLLFFAIRPHRDHSNNQKPNLWYGLYKGSNHKGWECLIFPDLAQFRFWMLTQSVPFSIQIQENNLIHHSVLLWQIFRSGAEDLIPQDLIFRKRLCGTGFITKDGWVVHFPKIIWISQRSFIKLPKRKSWGWPWKNKFLILFRLVCCLFKFVIWNDFRRYLSIQKNSSTHYLQCWTQGYSFFLN